MKVKEDSVSRTIFMDKDTKMEIEISEKLIDLIKEEYDIDHVNDHYIQVFFRDVLKDASTNILRDN